MRLPTQDRFETGTLDVPVTPAPPGMSPRRRAIVWGALFVALAGAGLIVSRTRAKEQANIREIVRQAALEERLDPRLAEAIVHAESGGNPHARSRAGACGLMQLMPRTAAEMAGRALTTDELFDPRLNARLGCRYMRRLLRAYEGDLVLSLMAYNAGMGRVAKWRAIDPDPQVILKEHAFRETRGYVGKVLRKLKDLHG